MTRLDPVALCIQEITEALKEHGECRAVFKTDQQHLISDFRAYGRKIGRDLGWKIQTVQSQPNDKGNTLVVIAVTKADEAHENRWKEQAFDAINRMWDRVLQEQS